MSVRRWLGLAVPLAALAATVATAGAKIPEPPDWDGDGAVATDCKPLDPAVHPGVIDKPDTTFEDTDCDGIDGDADGAYFVATTGNNANPGTRTQPLATIQEAIIRGRTTPKDIYVAAGAYARTDIARRRRRRRDLRRLRRRHLGAQPHWDDDDQRQPVWALAHERARRRRAARQRDLHGRHRQVGLRHPHHGLRAGAARAHDQLRACRRRHARHARSERARRRGRRRRDHRPAHRRQLRHAGRRRGQRQARDRPDHHGAWRQRRDRRRGDQRR